MEKKKIRWIIVAGILLLIGLVVLITGLLFFSQRSRTFNSRPLVLIHHPIHNDQIEVGERVILHASAREEGGLTRIEFWADGTLIATRDALDFIPTNLMLSSDWTPTSTGTHVLIVRAYSRNGVEGQASISIRAVEAGQDGTGIYTVTEGETLESIASDHGVSTEDLSELNPDLEPGGPVPGDDLVVPDDEPPAGDEEPLPEGDGDSPSPEGEAPLMGMFYGIFELFRPPVGEATLRIEIPSLRTWESYEGLHCYVSLAGSLPQWYPDTDFDQATDESFSPMDRGWWDTGDLEGLSAPVIIWPGDEPLPLTVSCVGVTGGGTEAIELGRSELLISPEDWNGTQLSNNIDGEGGLLHFTIRVTQLNDVPRGTPMYLDMDMTPPTNVRLNERRRSLQWDYNPEPDEEPIDGFRIYLNGTLQWVEPADARESGLPYEWFNPPCGSTYTFNVTAFRVGFPDGPESFPGIAILNQPLEDCQREIQITFITLETFDLGGDGRYEDRHGDVGPVYGHFYANEKQITFDGGTEGPGLDMPNGLRHHWTYDLSEMSADRSWRFSGMNGTIVEIPVGGTFEFGFHIMDRDTGRCRDSDDPGCNDLVCEGDSMIYEDSIGMELDRHHEGTLTSEDGRCRLTYRWGPAFDSPVGAPGEGGEPLPWLSLVDSFVEEGTGRVSLELRNTGMATWPWKDLVIELQNREGASLGVYTWPEFVLEPGQNVTIDHPDMIVDPPYDYCVVIDPYDDVPEGPERTGAMYHNPICPQLPDLVVTDAFYLERYGPRFRAFVQNIGDGPVESRTVGLNVTLPDGTPLFDTIPFSDVNLEPGETHIFEIPEVSPAIREQMAAGYVVTVNPDGRLREQNTENNSFVVSERKRVWIYWLWISVPYDVRNSVEFHLDAYVVRGENRQQVANWSIRQDIDWGSCFYPYSCVLGFDDEEYSTYWFDVYGDEVLEINIDVVHPGTLRRGYTASETFRPPDWGGGDPYNYSCHYHGERDTGIHRWVFDYLDGEEWATRFNICRENPDD